MQIRGLADAIRIDENNNSQLLKHMNIYHVPYGLKVVCKLDDELSSPYKEYKG